MTADSWGVPLKPHPYRHSMLADVRRDIYAHVEHLWQLGPHGSMHQVTPHQHVEHLPYRS